MDLYKLTYLFSDEEKTILYLLVCVVLGATIGLAITNYGT